MPLFTSEYVFSDDYPTIEPSLKLDFANARALDPRITFTRASTATYVGANGLIKTAGEDEARFDHDPSTGESLGLLIEESRTNLLPESEDLTSGLITTLSITTSNDAGVIAPDGTAGATRVIQDNTTAQHLIGDTAAGLTLGGYYTLSTFVKAGTTDLVWVSVNSYTNWVDDWNFFINLTTGSVYHNSNNISSANLKVEEYPNGWWRLSMVAQQEPAGGGAGGLWIGHANPDLSSSTNFAGDGSTYFYAWGFQMEAGSFPTSYIPTSGSTATRAIDVPVISGTRFSDFYNSSEGSIVVRYNINGYYATDGYNRIFEISDGTPNNRFTPLLNQTQQILYEVASIAGTNELTFNAIPISFGPFYTWVAGYKQNDFQRYSIDVNGNIDTNSDNTLNVSNLSVNQLNLGHQGDGAFRQLNGHLSSFLYYPKRLTNAQLQTLTQ